MTPNTALLRQVHPNFYPNQELSSQAFYPFPKDHNLLSVYDGDQISAADAYQHYTAQLHLASCGVWGVSCNEVTELGLTSRSDPLEESPAHAVIDFAGKPDKECRKLAKKLRALALARGCLHSEAA